MARRSAVEGGAVTGTVVGARALLLERGQALLVRRILDDAEDRAILGWRKPKGMVGDLVTAAVTGGRGPRLPHLGDDGAAGPAVVNVRRRRVVDEHGPAGSVVAGHHPADRPGHGCLRRIALKASSGEWEPVAAETRQSNKLKWFPIQVER
jgi:hypothetical protein